MGVLGPRVGGAHVDVNLKFDDNSLKTVGKQIQRQLSQLTNRLSQIGEQNGKVYRAIGRDAVLAWRSALGAAVASAPLIGSAISSVAGAATTLAGAFYSAVQSSFGFAPLLLSIGVAAGTAFLGLKSFFTALKNGDLSKLTPSARAAAIAVQGLAGAWGKVQSTVQENMFKGLADDIAKLGRTLLPALQTGLGTMANVLNGLAKEMLDYINSSAGIAVVNKLLTNSASIFDKFSQAIIPFLDGFLRLMNALSPAGERLAIRIADIAKKFQTWTQAEGFGKRINDMMLGAEKTAGLLSTVVRNLGAAISSVFGAANPATNTFLEMLVSVTQQFKEWTSSVEGQNSIATWAAQSVEVMRQFGRTASAVFEVIKELANPRVITSFLTTLEGAFALLGKLPLAAMVSGFASIAEALQPISSFFLAIIIAGAAFGVMVGNVMGQFGGLFSVLVKFAQFKAIKNILTGVSGGTKAVGAAAEVTAGKAGFLMRAWQAVLNMFNKVKSIIASVIGVFTKTGTATAGVATQASRLSTVFKPVLSILSKFLRFAGPVGIAIWIGTIIAKSKDLQSKFGEIWDAIKEVGSALSGAFSEIATALSPLAPAAGAVGKAIGVVVGWVDKLMGFAIGVFLDMIKYAFQSLANVIKGAGSIIAGLINILVGLFTLDFSKMWDGLKQMASGLWPLLQGVFGLFLTFFAPAKLFGIGAKALGGLWSGIKGAMPGILAGIGQFLLKMLQFFVTLTPRLVTFGWNALTQFGAAIGRALPGVLATVGRLIVGIFSWFGRLPGTLLSWAQRAMSSVNGAIASAVPKIVAAAGRIINGVVSWFAQLPGKVASLAQSTISRAHSAISAGISRIRSAAGNIVNGVISWFTQLPGKVASLAQSAISRANSAISSGVGTIRSAAGRIVSAVVGAIASLPGRLFSIAARIPAQIASGILSGIGKITGAIGAITSKIKGFLPGSPVKEGPLMAWNRGSNASGGGSNLIDALATGLNDLSPIKRAMARVAGAIQPISSERSGVTAAVAGSVSSGSAAPSYGDINIELRMEDLEGLKTLDDFLRMLGTRTLMKRGQ